MEAALAETGNGACFPGCSAGCSHVFISPAGAGMGPVPAETPSSLGVHEAWRVGLTF